MALYSLTNKGNIVQCKWNCDKKHEHYSGNYARAVKYFGVDETEVKSYGNLINILIYHQTSEYTVKKLSNELHYILINAQAEHKYWAPEVDRDQNAMDTILDGEKLKLVLDEKLCESLLKKDNPNSNKRVYMYRAWLKLK